MAQCRWTGSQRRISQHWPLHGIWVKRCRSLRSRRPPFLRPVGCPVILVGCPVSTSLHGLAAEAAMGARSVVVWLKINATDKSFRGHFACVFCFPCPSRLLETFVVVPSASV